MVPRFIAVQVVSLLLLSLKVSSKKDEFEIDKHTEEEEDKNFWIDVGLKELYKKIHQETNTGIAKNVILFIGDGMSSPTVTASRIYQGQRSGKAGEENLLEFEKFPYTGVSKPYCINRQVADSACSATALLCGVKSQVGTLGVSGKVKRSNCRNMNSGIIATSIIEWAQRSGKATGIVTTTRVTHATPAAAYAHSPDRTWELDGDVPGNCSSTTMDIAYQLINKYPGKGLNVILGGGRRAFFPKHENKKYGGKGKRKDNLDLIETWLRDKESNKKNAKYVWDKESLNKVDPMNTDFLLGLFSSSHMDYYLDADLQRMPTLSDMTSAAISILKKAPAGFVLLVEGGRIDHAHHGTMAIQALSETIEFSKAVDAAGQLILDHDTLIVATADHSHTMTINGYAGRGAPITGSGGLSNKENTPYSILSYANGPQLSSSKSDGTHRARFPSMVSLNTETHGGDDVMVYSKGPWAHLLQGVFEQSYIPYVLMYASCLGPYTTACSSKIEFQNASISNYR